MKLDPEIKFQNYSFSTTDSLLKFLDKEIEFWSKLNTNHGRSASALNAMPTLFQLEKAITAILSSDNIENNDKRREIDAHLNINPYYAMNFLNNDFISSSTPLAKKALEIHKVHGLSTTTHFIESIKNGKFQPITGINHNNITGILLAYEFANQDSDLRKRRSSEKKSISSMRADMEESLINCQDETANLITEASANLDNTQKEIDETKNDAATSFHTQLTNQDTEFKTNFQKWEKEKNRLEKLYIEDLRFKSPAEYWERLSYTNNIKALIVSIITLLFVGTALWLLTTFFITWLEGGQHDLDLGSLKGAFIFATIVAIFGFTFKSLSRFIFSSLHLAQDAKEREQLTHFYLALANETDLKKEDRELILTALFSRSESGLLTNENGPTLPVSDLAKAFRPPQ